MKKLFALLWLFLLGICPIAMAGEPNHAVIFIYHRFGENNYPSTNVTIEQFESHLRELARGGYQVWPTPKIVEHLKQSKPMPDRVVGITIDDAAMSVYTAAWPKLKKYNMPFTLFVTTDDVDRGGPAYMTWDMVRELAENELVTIGHHTASHPHMPSQTAQQNAAEIIRAESRFIAELGKKPELFAYPYGEYSNAVKSAVQNFGFSAAFGQYSGVADESGDFFAIPRFAMNENYGQLERFIQTANALPLQIRLITPTDPQLTTNSPVIELQLQQHDMIKSMDCFASDFGKVEIAAANNGTFHIALPRPWDKGRARINCTMADVVDGKKRWRWWGAPFIAP